jgi:tetratricopeptide (TPR) repeat protein
MILSHTSSLLRLQQAIEFFQRILTIDESNGEIWGALGNCYLMTDDLQSAYNSYQKALFHLQNPKVSLVFDFSSRVWD